LAAAATLMVAALALLAPHAAHAQAGSSRFSSASSAYGGQGQSITPGGQLPFTGLDLAGVLGVGVVLIGAGIALRWSLRRTGRRAH
jgi:hypothetical protein